MTQNRHYTFFDNLCLGIDQALRAVLADAKTTQRPYPAKHEVEPPLTTDERKHAAGLMRVNHAGEVCAQGLYQAQALVSRRSELKKEFQQAAIEEGDHLAWCSTRLAELGSHASYLNPLWYAGSFAIGLTASIAGDKWSLGFLAETENQVVKHLEKHLKLLPAGDNKSHKILQQMQKDETEHRDQAIHSGAAILPAWIKKWMRVTSMIMVKTAYWV
jgi:ubiquinone biosynthesis monooxygenase Coq7